MTRSHRITAHKLGQVRKELKQIRELVKKLEELDFLNYHVLREDFSDKLFMSDVKKTPTLKRL